MRYHAVETLWRGILAGTTYRQLDTVLAVQGPGGVVLVWSNILPRLKQPGTQSREDGWCLSEGMVFLSSTRHLIHGQSYYILHFINEMKLNVLLNFFGNIRKILFI